MVTPLKHERKFLIEEKFLKGYAQSDPREIEQGYISTGDVEVRLRRSRYKVGPRTKKSLTVKTPLHTGIRTEHKTPIDEDLFDKIFSELTIVKKVRTKVMHHWHKYRFFEIDTYGDRPLVVAEIEFNTEQKMMGFDPSIFDFLGEEVTGDERYSNAWLAEHPGECP